MEELIPLSIPNFEGREKEYALDAVSQGWVSTGGAYINQLEEQLAGFLHVPSAAACQSGTAALHLVLRECGVGPKDIVIVPTLTFIAAVNPVRYQFADPIFMDCDDSLCMDPGKLEEFCRKECRMQDDALVYTKTGQHIKAIVVVHVFGNLADLEAILAIARQYHLSVIEDATEALGSHYLKGEFAGKMAGTLGDFGAFSFNGNKIITTGGGGALVAKDPKRLDHMKYLSTQAKDDELFYEHHEVGFNYRMTNLQAAIGVAQMEMLPEFIRRKEKNYRTYCEKLKDISWGYMLPFCPDTSPNYWFYSLVLKDSIDLRKTISELKEAGIQTRPVWGLIHKQKPYSGCLSYRIEKAEYYSRRILNLPCSTQLTVEEISKVVKTLQTLLDTDK